MKGNLAKTVPAATADLEATPVTQAMVDQDRRELLTTLSVVRGAVAATGGSQGIEV